MNTDMAEAIILGFYSVRKFTSRALFSSPAYLAPVSISSTDHIVGVNDPNTIDGGVMSNKQHYVGQTSISDFSCPSRSTFVSIKRYSNGNLVK